MEFFATYHPGDSDPTSVLLDAAYLASAMAEVEEADPREWIDQARRDAEATLDLDAADTSETELDDMLTLAGCKIVHDYFDDPSQPHLAGWKIWQIQ
ncbi:MAG: hypothetical protein U5J62_06390 [Desulfurivibrio sp.]|nr:hypothetical protein [Desulfurivibrio sp.]